MCAQSRLSDNPSSLPLKHFRCWCDCNWEWRRMSTYQRPDVLPVDSLIDGHRTQNYVLNSVQVNMVSTRSGKPTRAATLLEVSLVFPWKCFSVGLIDYVPFSSFQRKSPSAFSFYDSVLQAIDCVIFLALCRQKASQAPQDLRTSET